jgi:hypothetical protein
MSKDQRRFSRAFRHGKPPSPGPRTPLLPTCVDAKLSGRKRPDLRR